MKKENKKSILGIVIGIIIIFAIYLILTNIGMSKENNGENTKTLNINKENFVILNSNYMNTFQESSCQKARAGDCSWIGQNIYTCDKDTYWITLKLNNFPSEIDVNSPTEINSNLIAKIYSNGELIGFKNTDETLQKNNFLNGKQGTYQINVPLKYTQENNLILCFQINGSQFYHVNQPENSAQKIISNEICLDSFKIDSLC